MLETVKSQLLHTHTAPAWQKVGIHAHHGINLPLSALRSEKSCGIGEFFDLVPLIDWCARLKLDILQLLPLNNSENDPSPYNLFSSCALNFIYLSLHALPHLAEHPALKQRFKEIRRLNESDQILYQEVLAHKLAWLHLYVRNVKESIICSALFQQFMQEHPWVKAYATFSVLRKEFNHISWKSWPREFFSPSSHKLNELYTVYENETSFYAILQYLCYEQLKSVKEYAKLKGVSLMGDLPILVSAESVDVWQYPHLFDTSLAAGAPPDQYNQEGQYWGFPIFIWEALKEHRYHWWKERLEYANHFFDIFRIDHIIGLFRLWAIPLHRPANSGFFVPTQEDQWECQGKEILSAITQFTTMLPVAEDLGIMPPWLSPLLAELGICSTKVMRWERQIQEGNSMMLSPAYYPPISLTCVSTHDSETLSLWWKKYPEEAKLLTSSKHWEYEETLSFDQRFEILWDSHHSGSLFHINLLQEYLALFPELTHPHAEEERINIPGTTLPSNWTYRFKASVEKIISHEGLAICMEKIVHGSCPCPLP